MSAPGYSCRGLALILKSARKYFDVRAYKGRPSFPVFRDQIDHRSETGARGHCNNLATLRSHMLQ